MKGTIQRLKTLDICSMTNCPNVCQMGITITVDHIKVQSVNHLARLQQPKINQHTLVLWQHPDT